MLLQVWDGTEMSMYVFFCFTVCSVLFRLLRISVWLFDRWVLIALFWIHFQMDSLFEGKNIWKTVQLCSLCQFHEAKFLYILIAGYVAVNSEVWEWSLEQQAVMKQHSYFVHYMYCDVARSNTLERVPVISLYCSASYKQNMNAEPNLINRLVTNKTLLRAARRYLVDLWVYDDHFAKAKAIVVSSTMLHMNAWFLFSF